MVDLSREDQDKMIAEFIEKNGATRLTRDARLDMHSMKEAAIANEAEAQALRDAGPLAKKEADSANEKE